MGTEVIAGGMTDVTVTHGGIEVPSVLRCGLLILAVKTSLKVAGFDRTRRWIRRYAQRNELVDSGDTGAIAATEYAVAMAAAVYPGRAQCLERSLVLYYYLRRRGVAVQFLMGVQMYPFMAHAWVEYQGVPINDVEEHVKLFTPIEDMTT
jgi:hypothetical protein